MTHEEQRIYLIQKLLDEEENYKNIVIPSNKQEQKNLLRGLMNVRMPKPVNQEFLHIQDEYLQTERDQRGVVDSSELSSIPGDPSIILWRGDITTLKIDAIVNAANSALLGCFHPLHGCIDNIIHSRSGVQLRLICDDIMRKQGYEEPIGKAKITPAYNLPSRYVIHTVGPIVAGVLTKKHCQQLADCYRSCLEIAAENGLKSIAFCCISTGEFHFPRKKAAEIAVKIVREYLKKDASIERVVFNVFKSEDQKIYQEILE